MGKNGTWTGGNMTWDSEIVDGLVISTPKSEAVWRSFHLCPGSP